MTQYLEMIAEAKQGLNSSSKRWGRAEREIEGFKFVCCSLIADGNVRPDSVRITWYANGVKMTKAEAQKRLG